MTTVAKVDETTVGTEMTEVATDAPTTAKAAETIEAPEMEVKTSEPTTIGPVQNATTPTLPAARSVTDAKNPDPVVAASVTTEAVIDTSTTGKVDGITVGSEMTVGVETMADPSGTPSTIMIGLVHNVTIPTSRSETRVTDARHLDQVAAVAVVNEAEAALPMVANATTGVKVVGTDAHPTADSATIVGTEVGTDAHLTADNATKGAEASGTVDDETVAAADKVAGKAAVTTAHVVEVALNVVDPLMEAFEEPKASAPAMPITVHLKISERPVHLNEKKTEWT